MSSIFVSYSSKERTLVKSVADDLHDLGHVVWFAPELSGGHEWWADILTNIRACDIFVFALSPLSIKSYPCKLEYTYAYALGKLILPIMLDDVNTPLLPPALSKIQFVDYRHPENTASVKALAKALHNLPPTPPLPDPLPTPPDAPISQISKLADRIDAPELPLSEQTTLVFELKNLLDSEEDANARLLLERLLKHPDLRASVAQEINGILATSQKASIKRDNVKREPQREAPPPHREPSTPLYWQQSLGVAAIRLFAIVVGMALSSIFFTRSLDLRSIIFLPCSIVATIELPILMKNTSKSVRVLVPLFVGAIFFFVAEYSLSLDAFIEAVVFLSGFAVGAGLLSSVWKRFFLAIVGVIAGIILFWGAALLTNNTIYPYGSSFFGAANIGTSSILALVLAICAFVPEYLQYVRSRGKRPQIAS